MVSAQQEGNGLFLTVKKQVNAMGRPHRQDTPVRLCSGGDSGVSPSGLGKRAFAEFQRAPL